MPMQPLRPAPRRLTVAQMRRMRTDLESARDDLLLYLEPENRDCSISPAARRESGLFLDSYVLPQIQTSLAILNSMLGE